jgi:hypothetical protein
MKTAFTLSKITNLMLVFFLISTGISCKDQNNQKTKIEDDMSFAGSSKRDNICQLIDKEDVQSIFGLSDEISIKQKESKSAVCSYEWTAKSEKILVYTLMLNFARGEKRNNSQIDAVWKGQNTGVYSKHNLQKVSCLGDKASWSDLGGGQLRVAANGYIFFHYQPTKLKI